MSSKEQVIQVTKNVTMESLYRYHCLQQLNGRQTMLEEAALGYVQFQTVTELAIETSWSVLPSMLVMKLIAVQSLVLFQFYKL